MRKRVSYGRTQATNNLQEVLTAIAKNITFSVDSDSIWSGRQLLRHIRKLQVFKEYAQENISTNRVSDWGQCTIRILCPM
jgi:hypothetical protein